MQSGCAIRDEGAEVIGEALKINTSLTEVNLETLKTKTKAYFDILATLLRTTKLEMKEQKPSKKR